MDETGLKEVVALATMSAVLAFEEGAKELAERAFSDDDGLMLGASILLEMAHDRAGDKKVDWDTGLASDVAEWESK